MSAALTLVFGALIPALGALAVLLAIAIAGWATWTPTGERTVAKLFSGGREPTMFQRYTLAPVAQLLLTHTGDTTEHRQLLVIRHRDVLAYGYGRGTLLVSAGLIEALARNRIPASEAAAVIAHEFGVMRAGLTRGEPGLIVLLLPWRLWLTLMGAIWQVAQSVIPGPLFRIAPGLVFGAVLWLGYSRGEPSYFLAAGLLALAFGTYRAHLWWVHERSRVGDRYVYQCGLGNPLANILMRSHDDLHTRNRVVRLRTGVFPTRRTDTGWATPAPGDFPARP